MGRYSLPAYQPNGCRVTSEFPLELECDEMSDHQIRISGHPHTVQHFHNYFTGLGYEDNIHSPLERGIGDMQHDDSFIIDIKEARRSIYDQKIGVLFFDLILDGVEKAAHGDMLHKHIR